MRESLRKVAHLALQPGVVFFAEQTEIVAQREQPIDHVLRLGMPALPLPRVSQPETAGEKDAFTRRQTICAALGAVSRNKAIDQQLAFDRRDGATDARVIDGQESDMRNQQQARIQLVAIKALGE